MSFDNEYIAKKIQKNMRRLDKLRNKSLYLKSHSLARDETKKEVKFNLDSINDNI
jgi:hypothetical protein